MAMYVLQVRSGSEESAAAALRERGYTVLCPAEEMHIRRGGSWHLQRKLLFTQYLFIECKLTDEDYYRIKNADGVVRFLGFGKPEALSSAEALYIKILDNGGVPIEASKVYSTAAGAKMVLSGVLRNYVNDIVSLDLRQRRAKIEVEIFGKKHEITLPVVGI